MAIGKKTTTDPEIGDIVSANVARCYVFENEFANGVPTEYPMGARIGAILEITAANFRTDKGWVEKNKVIASVNPMYNYGGTSGVVDNRKFNWGTFLGGIAAGIGSFFGSKSATQNDTRTAPPVQNNQPLEKGIGDTEKKAVPIWVYGIGALAIFGILAAIFWPKKKKVEPIVI